MIQYPTVCSVTLAYPKEALKDDVRRDRPGLGKRMFGFGNLIPRSQKVRGTWVMDMSSRRICLVIHTCHMTHSYV